MQNLERENANLKDKLDAEKKKTRVWFTWKCRSNKKTEKKLILFYQVLNFCGFLKFGFFYKARRIIFVFIETPRKPDNQRTVFLAAGRIKTKNQ